jgi:hypothetical protein
MQTSLVYVTLQTTTVITTLSVSKVISTSVVYVTETTTELGSCNNSQSLTTQLQIPSVESGAAILQPPSLTTETPQPDAVVDVIETDFTTVLCTTATSDSESLPWVPEASDLPPQLEGTPPNTPEAVPCKACKHGQTNGGSNEGPNGGSNGGTNGGSNEESNGQPEPAPPNSNTSAGYQSVSASPNPPGQDQGPPPAPNNAAVQLEGSSNPSSGPGPESNSAPTNPSHPQVLNPGPTISNSQSNSQPKNGSSSPAASSSGSQISDSTTQVVSSTAATSHSGGLVGFVFWYLLALATLFVSML